MTDDGLNNDHPHDLISLDDLVIALAREQIRAAELERTLERVESVCMNTDGDYLDGDVEIPVGEVLRMIHGDIHPALGEVQS